MKIAVVGAGGVGGYFGARLAAAGNDVTFLARGAHLAAILKDGLKVQSPKGDVLIRPAKASDDPAACGKVDIVMFCVKLWDTETAGRTLSPLLGPDTAVIPFQNGIEAPEILTRLLGARHVMGGVAHIGASIAAPGRIEHLGTLARLMFGEIDRTRSARVEAFHAACAGAGFDAQIAPDIGKAIWEKFVFLVALSGTTSVTRMPIAAVLADPDTRAMFEAAIRETAAIARARGAALDPDTETRTIGFAATLPAGMRSSMLNDLERGNRLELDWLSGCVARLGKELGVPTPVNEFIRIALKLRTKGAPV